MASARVKGVMKLAMRDLYWQLRARVWDMKWLTVMKVRGIEYAARKFDETEIHRSHQRFRPKKATIVRALVMAIMAIAIMSMCTFGALAATHTISNNRHGNGGGNGRGNERAVGVNVYSDTACTNAVSTISWAALKSGDVKIYTIYVKNVGTVPLTLSMTTGNWNPSIASRYMTLTWNQQNYVLPAGQVVQAVFTLTVSSNARGVANFSFDMTITGTR